MDVLWPCTKILYTENHEISKTNIAKTHFSQYLVYFSNILTW